MFARFATLIPAMLLLASNGCASAQQATPGSRAPAPASSMEQAQAPATTAQTAMPVKAPEQYVLGVNDEVEVTIFGAQNQVVRTRVKEDGTITVPYAGPIKASGNTARELAQRVQTALEKGGYLINPVVNVDVTQFISNVVTVSGNVATPGIYPLDRSMTVAMLVARAGGARPDGADFALLRRPGDPQEHRIEFDTLEGQWSGATALLQGDTLLIPEAPTFFAYGQVKSPGVYAIKSGMTIRQALARAGGPTLGGSENKVTIYRGKEKLKKLDLDSAIQPDDTLFVRERLF